MGILDKWISKLAKKAQVQPNMWPNDSIAQPPKNSKDQQNEIFPTVTLNSEPVSQQPQTQSFDNIEHPVDTQNSMTPKQEGWDGGMSVLPPVDINSTNVNEQNNPQLNPAEVSSYNEKIGRRMVSLGISSVDKAKFIEYYKALQVEAAQKGVSISSLIKD